MFDSVILHSLHVILLLICCDSSVMEHQKYDFRASHTTNHQYSVVDCPADTCSLVSRDDTLQNFDPEKMLSKIRLQAKKLKGC